MALQLKKILMISCIICFISLGVGFADGQNVNKPLDLPTAKKMAVLHSLDLKKLALNIKKLETDREDLKENIANISYQINRATAQAIALEQEINNARAELANNPSPERQAELQAIIAESTKKFNAFAGGGGSTDQYLQRIDSIEKAMESLSDSEKLQIPVIEYNAEMQYLNLLSMESQIKVIEKNVSSMERLLHVERIKSQLGLSSTQQLENIFFNVNQLKNNLQTLKIQKKNAYTNFKKIIGYPLNEELVLEEIETTAIAAMPTYATDLKLAMEQGKNIRYLEQELKRKEKYIDDLRNKYDGSSNVIEKEKIDFKQAQLELEEVKTKTEINLKTAYNHLMMAKDKLEIVKQEMNLAEKTYNNEKIKCEVGMASKIEYEAKEADYEIKKLIAKQAEYDYLKALSAYELAKNGIMVSLGY